MAALWQGRIEKHLTKKDFVRVFQFFELPKITIWSTVYFWDDSELSARKRIKAHLWMPTSSAKNKTVNRLDVRRSSDVKKFLFLFFFLHTIYCIFTIYMNFLSFQFFEHSLIWRQAFACDILLYHVQLGFSKQMSSISLTVFSKLCHMMQEC